MGSMTGKLMALKTTLMILSLTTTYSMNAYDFFLFPFPTCGDIPKFWIFFAYSPAAHTLSRFISSRRMRATR